jgi:CDP-2,3-bis-(O-geranylgeranyl)-sn-glycerol synthase
MPSSAVLITKILFLLLLANGTPVIAKKLLGSRLAYPLDGGRNFIDGRALFGNSKTIRGIFFSVLVTSFGALLIGYSVQTGVLFSAASLSGDLVSSFIKRRLNLPPSSRALGLDQLPEAIFPLLICWQALALDLPTAMTVVVIFFCSEIVLSRLLFRLHIRDHPY